MKKWILISVSFLLALSFHSFAEMPQVDLEIFGPAVVDPQIPSAGGKVTITLYIYNYGPEDVSGPVKIDWKVNGKNIGQTMIMGILTDEQKEITNTFKVKEKINKLRVSIATKMVPYKDINADNNLYEEEITFENFTVSGSDSTQGGTGTSISGTGETGEQNNRSSGNRTVTNPQKEVLNNPGTNSSSQGQGGTSTGTAGGSSSNKSQGNPSASGNSSGSSGSSAGSSSSSSSSRASKSNTEESVSPSYADNELNKVFTIYLMSYMKFNQKLVAVIAGTADSNIKTTLTALKQDTDSLHSSFIAINTSVLNGSNSTAASGINWVALEALLSKIDSNLGNFDELEEVSEDYIDKAEDYLSKAKNTLS